MNRWIKAGLPAALVAAALVGCGSSSDDGPAAGGGATGTDVPQSAQSSVDGLIAYVNNLIATMTNETGEPVKVGDVTLPTSDTTEPVN